MHEAFALELQQELRRLESYALVEAAPPKPAVAALPEEPPDDGSMDHTVLDRSIVFSPEGESGDTDPGATLVAGTLPPGFTQVGGELPDSLRSVFTGDAMEEDGDPADVAPPPRQVPPPVPRMTPPRQVTSPPRQVTSPPPRRVTPPPEQPISELPTDEFAKPVRRAPVNERSPRRSSSRRALVFVASAAAGILLTVVVFLLLPKGGGTGTSVRVNVAQAENAQITIGGRLVARDTAVPFPPGEYDVVVVAPGYKRYTQKVTIFEHEPVANVTILLEPEVTKEPSRGTGDARRDPPHPVGDPELPPEPQTFSARFDAKQPGIELLVDGKKVGLTPDVRASGLAMDKPHHFEARHAGTKVAEGDFRSDGAPELIVVVALDKPVTPVQGDRRVTSPKVTPPKQSKEKGRLTCTSEPAGAQVFIDGQPTGRRTPVTDDDPVELAPGPHKVSFLLGGMKSEVRKVEIRANQTATLQDVAVNLENELF
jgi:hypothetical protein